VAGAELRTVNAGFASVSPEDAFIERVAGRYHGRWARMSFAEPGRAAKAINQWVADQTNDRIDRLIHEGDISTLTELVLINATYLDADWEEPFLRHATKDGAFHISPERSVTAKTMHQRGRRYDYAATEQVQVLRLPYRGESLSMLIVLPRAVDGLAAVEKTLSVDQLARWTGAMRQQSIDHLALPNFEMRTHANIDEALRALGMTRAFDATQAEFAGVDGAGGLFIRTVVHEAWLRVDEEGTEAAAGTAVVAERAAEIQEQPVRFIADRPFLYMIRHDPTGAILFLGRVTDPTAGR